MKRLRGALTHIDIYQDKAGGWRWRAKAPNGRIVADSGEAYHSKWNAERAAAYLFGEEHNAVHSQETRQPMGDSPQDHREDGGLLEEQGESADVSVDPQPKPQEDDMTKVTITTAPPGTTVAAGAVTGQQDEPQPPDQPPPKPQPEPDDEDDDDTA